MMPELLTVTDAARLLQVSTALVRRACQEGRLKAVKIGPRAWVIEVGALAAWRGGIRR